MSKIQILEVSSGDIQKLDDSDLRDLVGLLCEAELRSVNLSTKGVTWGGDQDAADGGIDVRVEGRGVGRTGSFIPRDLVGFQVKKQPMPGNKIISEMRPGGQLRPAIKELTEREGAYIIVSSGSNLSDTMLQTRIKAMASGLDEARIEQNLALDFYDCSRLATWIRNHPSLVLWVKSKIGVANIGWCSYGNWSGSEEHKEFLIDDKLSIGYSGSDFFDIKDTLSAIHFIRSRLNNLRSSIRFIGHSGVGKTRLVQALFDQTVGSNALNQSQVYYCDAGSQPMPTPSAFASILSDYKTRAFLVVDNCPSELHYILHEICIKEGSEISLITIEYDIRDDQPESTEVFRIDTASESFIAKLIRNRFKNIDGHSADRIASFSGGNARIAIALAESIKVGDNVLQMNDDTLFKRLFYQRNQEDDTLLVAAQACSLVYSFDCDTSEGYPSELKFLAAIADQKPQRLFRQLSLLKDRGLVQERGIWKAVLPHVLANRLAEKAISEIPAREVLNFFLEKSDYRLQRSFSRRLGYLQKSEKAKNIARLWLNKLGDLINIDREELAILLNLAPLIREEVLLKIVLEGKENFDLLTRRNSHFTEIVGLLISLAYEEHLFERSTALLIQFSLSEHPNENVNSIRHQLKRLFQIILSGTHAPASMRFEILRSLLQSESDVQQTLGLQLLRSSLSTHNFMGNQIRDFGVEFRDYGYHPMTLEEVRTWYELLFEVIFQLTEDKKDLSVQLKQILGQSFRGLWKYTGLQNECRDLCKRMVEKGPWIEGWISVRHLLQKETKMESAQLSVLQELEERLKPKDLESMIRTYAFKGERNIMELKNEDEDIHETFKRISTIARDLGNTCGSLPDILRKMLSEILQSNSQSLHDFGAGVVQGADDLTGIWIICEQEMLKTGNLNYYYTAIIGAIKQLEAQDLSALNKFLTYILQHDQLSGLFPSLQCNVLIDDLGLHRLRRATKARQVPIGSYCFLPSAVFADDRDHSKFCLVVRDLFEGTNDVFACVEIVNDKLNRSKKPEIGYSLKDLGWYLIEKIEFGRECDRETNDYLLAEIIKRISDCKYGDSISTLCSKMIDAIKSYHTSIEHNNALLKAIATTSPEIFLDYFVKPTVNKDLFCLADNFNNRTNPMSEIDENVLLSWCSRHAAFENVAYHLEAFFKDDQKIAGWNPFIFRLLEGAVEPIEFLENLRHHFYPRTYSGNRTDRMEEILKLLLQLKRLENEVIQHWVDNEIRNYKDEILKAKKWQDEIAGLRDEPGFE